MNILIATPLLSTQSGGPAQYAVNLKECLQQKRHKVHTLAFQSVARYPSGLRHLFLFFKALRCVYGTDAVIVLDTFSIALPVVIAGFILRKRIIVRVGGDFVWEQYVERTKEKITLSEFYNSKPSLSAKELVSFLLQKKIVFSCANTIVFSTTWQRDIWLTPYSLMKKNVVVIENAFVPHTSSRRTNTNSDTVVWIGRNITLKNVDVLDKAMDIVKMKYPTVNYQKYSNIPHTEVIEVLKNSKLLVLPSLSEVSPNLVFEALVLGVPVVMTMECGLANMLADTVTLINPKSVESIADGVSKLMTKEGYENALSRTFAFKSIRTYDHVADEFLQYVLR